MSEAKRNFIGGEWVPADSGETFATENPAAPADDVARYPQSGSGDTVRAIEAADEASETWASTPAPERGRVLSRTARRLADRKDELTEMLVREEGKTRPEAAGEVQRAIDIFDYYGSKARDLGGTVKAASGRDTDLYTVQEPLGVVGLITPWNYPIAIPTWKLAPALATGNTVVLKPASLAPGAVHEVIRELDRVGLPDGVVNLVTGPGRDVGGEIATNERVDAISFTGSTEVGNGVYDQATDDGKRVQLEMGGKNPLVVTANADPETAAEIAADGAFGVTGQACTATSRAIVHEAVYDEFVDHVVDEAESIAIGDGLDDVDMGPQVSESELASTLEYVDIGRTEGATLETGGEARDQDGYFVSPAVFSDVEPDMRIASEEIFGPVLSVIPADGFDAAVTVANDVEYGLSAGIVTDDHSEANRFVDRIEAGVVKVNEKTTGLELHVPFGGVKASSSETYREQGDAALDFYSVTKTVYDNY